ncbi:hypothetical protein [Haloprofundus marisrubri]|uniref:hypothetical protein n=1 Tax=Haloprofundus marisrubri TaxID=1514971 RepID=UPI0012BAE731|nr:hypothetical protein [Haloprofundus marisrubri]
MSESIDDHFTVVKFLLVGILLAVVGDALQAFWLVWVGVVAGGFAVLYQFYDVN